MNYTETLTQTCGHELPATISEAELDALEIFEEWGPCLLGDGHGSQHIYTGVQLQELYAEQWRVLASATYPY